MAFDPTWLQGLALLETQGGAKTIKGPNGQDSFNLYNIKDFSGQGFRAHDKAEGSRDAYRVYGSPDEATADLMGLLQRKYPAALQAQSPVEFAAALKQGGYATDPAYVNKLVNSISRAQGPEAAARLKAQDAAIDGTGAASQLKAFRDAGYGELIDGARERGYSDKDIATKLGGTELQAGVDARNKADARGFLGNAVAGASNAMGDVVQGAKQLGARMTGDDARLAQLQAQQRDELQSLDRRATDNASGAGLGGFAVKAAPYVAAGVATGGAGLLPMALTQGAVGAAEGALTPTTEEGQFGKNIAMNAALAGGGTGVLGLAGKGLNAAASKALRPSAEAVEQATQRAALADRFELTKTPAMLNDRARGVLDALPAAKAESEDMARRELSRQLLRGVGQEGVEVTPEVIAQARKAIYNDADTLLKDVRVPADTAALAPKLNKVVDDYRASTLKTYRSGEVESVANDLLERIGSGELSAQALIQTRKNVMNNAYRADGDTKSALQAIGRTLDDHLRSIAPAAKAALDKANGQWGNLQVLEKIVEMTRGQNTLTVPQLATAIKTTSRNLFQTGEAPYQDLADAALKLYGPNTSKNLSSVIAKQLGGHDGLMSGAAILEPTVGIPALIAKLAAKHLLGKAVSSDSPAVLRLLTGSTDAAGTNGATNAFIAKALGAAGDAVPSVATQGLGKSATDELRRKRAVQST